MPYCRLQIVTLPTIPSSPGRTSANTILSAFGGWTRLSSTWMNHVILGDETRRSSTWIRRAITHRISTLNFVMDFGSSLGHHFGSLFDIFCHLDRQQVCLDCRHDFHRLSNGKPADFWCPNLSIYMVNTDVFIRYHFFDFFVNLMILDSNLDLILDTSGGLGRPVWWFWEYWRFIGVSLNSVI